RNYGRTQGSGGKRTPAGESLSRGECRGRWFCSGVLRPADARRGRGDGQDLSCSRLCDLGDLLNAPPLGRYEKQRALTRAPEHAGEAAAVKVDRLQHLTTLADAHAPFVGNVAVPDRVVAIEADAVGDAVAEVGPDAPLRQTPVRADATRGESFCVGLGNDQRRVVG